MQPERENCRKKDRCPSETCKEDCEHYEDTFVRIKKESRMIRCQLSQKELLEYGEQLSEAIDNLQNTEAEEKQVAKEYKAKKAAFESDVSKLSTLLRAKHEMRSIDCEIRHDYVNAKIFVCRTDTEEVIEEREMRDDERQRHMDFMDTVTPSEEPHEEPEASVDLQRVPEDPEIVPPVAQEPETESEYVGQPDAPPVQSAPEPTPEMEPEEEVPENDPYLQKAIELSRGAGKSSITGLRKLLNIGHARASNLMDTMEKMGIVGPANGANPRDVIG